VRAAIESNDAAAAGKELLNAVKVITKAATKGVIHRNTASRYVSRLSKQVAGLGA
jgi:small subunit ribosomal protein S20